MKLSSIIIALATISMFISCGPKEVKKVCAGGVRSEFREGPVYATVEEGCVLSYDAKLEYKATGSVNLKIDTDNNVKKIHLSKGYLSTTGGEFIIKSDQTKLKVRMIAGQGKVTIGDKEVNLEINKVLEAGG